MSTTATETEIRTSPARTGLAALALGALGVVYGDIGTSPLYALRSCFRGPTGVAASHENVLGVLSLIFWALIVIVSVKYIAFVLRADNRAEGGILELMALAFPERERAKATRAVWLFTILGIFGAALLYGDGLITPAITVLATFPRRKVPSAAKRRPLSTNFSTCSRCGSTSQYSRTP